VDLTKRLARRPTPLLGLVLAICLGVPSSGRAASVVLFTAASQDSGNNFFASVYGPGVPNNNGNIPLISTGVTLRSGGQPVDPTLGVALSGQPNTIGPLGGIPYGPNGFGGNDGGTTGFVNSSFTLTAAGTFQLLFEVAGDPKKPVASSLAVDNVRLNGTVLFGFESGLPAGFTSTGTTGTSPAVPGLSPTEGTRFAYLDSTGLATPIFDTSINHPPSASRLLSTVFTGRVGDVLTLDLAFQTNDGGPAPDDAYGIAELINAPTTVPEPASLTLLASALTCLAFTAWLRRGPSLGSHRSHTP
jgi:hypothetical protein